MVMKKCLRCDKTEAETAFYPSTFGRCKLCQIEISKETYNRNRETLLPIKREYSAQYRNTHRDKVNQWNREWAHKNPQKRSAHYAIARAVRKGTVQKSASCEICGKTPRIIHGHHPDYSKLICVMWLCPTCHRKQSSERQRAPKSD